MQKTATQNSFFRPRHGGGQHLIMLALCLVLTGCAYVDTPEGKTPLNLQGQEAAWTGYWFDGEMMIRTRVENAEQGTLQAAWIDTHDNTFALEKMRFLLRQTDDTLYANAEVTPGGQYLPLRITKTPAVSSSGACSTATTPKTNRPCSPSACRPCMKPRTTRYS